jgi:hypothetical protein
MMAWSGEESGPWEGRRVGKSSLRKVKREPEMKSSMAVSLIAALWSSVW